MRIAHVTATFPPYMAGTGYVADYQTRELARRGHEMHVFTAADGAAEHALHGAVHVHRLPATARVGNAPVLPGLLELARFDAVHLHYPFISGAELIWAACRARRIPYVAQYHNDLIGVGLRDAIFKLYSRLCSGLVLGGAERILAVTLDHALNCNAAPLFRRHPERLVELYNGVDADHFRPAAGDAARAGLQIPQQAEVVLFVGALDAAHHFKGLSTLLRAFARVGGAERRLLVVGDGDMRAHYQREAAELGIAGQACFAGRVAHAELPAYYAAADVVVLPSSPPESFGMVLIEGMACGKPVIGSRIPGVRSLIDEGRDGRLAEAGDVGDLAAALGALLDLPADARSAIGRAGRRKVEQRFTWARVADRLESLYAELISERQSAAAARSG
jgi:glycosyltransferase involved in cell wall biosynthesis